MPTESLGRMQPISGQPGGTAVADTEKVSRGNPSSKAARMLGPLWRSRFFSNVALLSLSTALAQAVNVLLTPVWTRLYSPADLGKLGLFTSFLNVAVVGVSLRYELGIISARNDTEAARLTWASVLLSVPVAVVSSLVLYGIVRWHVLGFGALPSYVVLLMIGALVLTGVFSSLRYFAIRQQQFKTIARTTVAQQVTRAVSQTGFGLASAGAGGLFVSELFGRAAGVISLVKEAWPRIKELALKARPRELKATLGENRKLAIYSLPSSLIDTTAANILLPLLVLLYGTSAGGEYALVQKVLAVPVVLVADSVADTFHGRFAECVRERPSEMMSLFNRTTLGLFLMGLVPATLLALAGSKLFGLVFGAPWASAGTLAALTAPFLLSQMIVSPLSRLVFVLRGQESKLVYDLVVLVGMIATFKIASVRGLSLAQTVCMFSLMNTFAYGVYYFVLRRIVVSAHATATF